MTAVNAEAAPPALHLVARRADLMAAICDRVEGTMAAVLGLDLDDLVRGEIDLPGAAAHES